MYAIITCSTVILAFGLYTTEKYERKCEILPFIYINCNLKNKNLNIRVMWCLALLSQKWIPGLNPLAYWDLPVLSLGIPASSHRYAWVQLIGISRMAVSRMIACLSVLITAAVCWTVQGLSCILPYDIQDRFWFPCGSEQDRQRKWI